MNTRLRLLVEGRPKAGKTGLCAALLNAGFRVGLLDFDLNSDPLHVYAPKAADRLSVIPLRDKLGANPDGSMSFKDEPTAMMRAHKAIDDWGKVDPAHPWGSVRTWGPDSVLVADSLTGMGDAAFNLTAFLNNRKSLTRVPDWIWGAAMRDQDNWVARLMGPEFGCHVILTAHIKPIGPRIERVEKDDDPDLVSAKTAVSLANAELIPTRYYPTALGKALPQEITRRVPAAVLVEQDDQGGRWIWVKPPRGMPIDIGVPGMDTKTKLEHPDGILEIMQAVTGYRAPPVEKRAA